MKNLFLLITLILNILGFSQTLKVNNFKLVTYENASKEVKILSYTTIDKKGKLIVFLDDEKSPSYYSYQLTKNEIVELNKLFKKNFQEFIERKKLDDNEHYAGSRNFISYNYYKAIEQICFITPFMDSEFNEIIDLLQNKIYKQEPSAKISKFEIDFDSVKNSILIQEKKDNYLPQKELPPPVMR